VSLLKYEPESYYPRHASMRPDEIHITADYRPARYDPLISVARVSVHVPAVQDFDGSAYERPLPPPCLRVTIG
jgi:hypothetical protein